MSVEERQALEFINTHHRAVLATYRRDGTAQMSPVVAAADSEGRLLVSTREGASKTANLRRDPRVALVAFTDGFFGPWVAAWGQADVISLPPALPLLEDYYRRVVGEHPDWEEYREAMKRERRVLLRITVQRWGPERSG
ncbi:MAG: TIGR03618 family F420-dependent PPOX class oxidoreductase [Candidatus Dormiibacterota bacterium]